MWFKCSAHTLSMLVNNKSHLLSKANYPIKFEGPGSNDEQKLFFKNFFLSFKVTVTLAFDLLNIKATGLLNSIKAIILWRLKAVVKMALSYWTQMKCDRWSVQKQSVFSPRWGDIITLQFLNILGVYHFLTSEN